MSGFLIEFVKFFMSTKLREEIEDELEIDTKMTNRERDDYIQQISDAWKRQGEISKDVDIRPIRYRF